MLLLLLGICASIVALVAHLRSRRHTTAELLARLPWDDAIILSIDFAALRRAGVLQVLAAPVDIQEPEYRAFVRDTGFNYLEDLDFALVSFHGDGRFFLLRGRFNWKSWGEYVVRQGGSCYNSMCDLAGSTPERWISYCPLHPGLMALAVAKTHQAAMRLASRKPGKLPPPISSQPAWSFIPASALKETKALPPATRAFAKPLEGAESVVLALGLQADGMEALLEATCRSPGEAAGLASQLQRTTSLLRERMARENRRPDPGDLTGVLAAGVFRQQDSRVFGRWPIKRAFFEALAGGPR